MCGGSDIVVEHEGRCDEDWQDKPCAICRGEVSDEFLTVVARAAAQPGRVMTAEEAMEWLESL
jgi:hypothetical protein